MYVFAQYRWNVYKGIRHAIDQNEGGIDTFSQGVVMPMEFACTYRYVALYIIQCHVQSILEVQHQI
jgi:hypothetical protein